MPDLLAGALAVALVALAQAAGIGAAVPNPDGSLGWRLDGWQQRLVTVALAPSS